jgi:phosphatidylethanolamine/phosphatidyl-N-methylethanolamine N-methyltransferase
MAKETREQGRWGLKVLSVLVGAASVVAFLLLHAAMGWLHLLLLPVLLYLLVVLMLGLRARRWSTPTEVTRQRYDRIAPLYDLVEGFAEIRARRWRRELWQRVDGARVLELGVGTGKNLRFYPPDREVVAVDLSPAMLARAQRRAARLGSSARLEVADAQALPYPDASFDTVIGTFVFCSVPDALRGLKEARRVLVPGGRLLLLEHVLSKRPGLRRLMRWLDPLPANLWGAHIDRETVEAVRAAGFTEIEERDLSLDIVKHVVGRGPADEAAPLPSGSEASAGPAGG